MGTEMNAVETHYDRQDSLVSGILGALADAGHDLESLDPKVLSGADEFHLGGRATTLAVLESIRSDPPTLVLDVGCGIGGPARTIATEFDARVVGVDLTSSFVGAASELTALVGLGDRVSFEVGDALNLEQPDGTFDLVTVFHVGMNIADKRQLFTELARVLQPGGRVLVYDIMRVAPGELRLPMPWASSADHQHLSDAADYLRSLRAADLEPGHVVDHRPIVRKALEHAADTPPPVNLSHLMGADFSEMFSNLHAAMTDGLVAPCQIVARKPD